MISESGATSLAPFARSRDVCGVVKDKTGTWVATLAQLSRAIIKLAPKAHNAL